MHFVNLVPSIFSKCIGHQRLFAVLLCLPLVAQATDINCSVAEKKKYEELICDYSILNNQYEKIFNQQEFLAANGKISDKVISGWRLKRNSCVEVSCMDGVFSEWEKIIADTDKAASTSTSLNSESINIAITQTNNQPAVKLPAVKLSTPTQPPIQEKSNSDSNSGPVITLVLILGLYFWLKDAYKCPQCKRRFKRKEINREKISENTVWVEKEVEDEHRDRDGRRIGSTVRKTQVPKTVSTYRVFYRCKNCGYESNETE